MLLSLLNSYLIYILKIVLSIIPKEDNLILFSAWFGQKYADNCRFQYEYMLDKGIGNVYWYTRNIEIYRGLKAKNMPVVYSKSIKGFWKQLRAKILVSSVQFADFNNYLLTNCIYFDLDHGFALKQIAFAQPDSDKKWCDRQMLLRKHIDYYMTGSSEFCKDKIHECYRIAPNKIAFCNKPRIDVFFDKRMQRGINEYVDEIKNGRKAIIWMPTHRSCGNVPIDTKKIFNLDFIQALCEKNNCVFIIKKHFYHQNEEIDTRCYPNIFDLSSCDNIDSQVLLSQADVLISDYSSCYIDYLVLDRPILLYAYDYDDFVKHERGLYVPFSNNGAGQFIKTSKELDKALERICLDWYDSEYAPGRKKARLRYFDESLIMGEARLQVANILKELLSGVYKSKWQ